MHPLVTRTVIIFLIITTTGYRAIPLESDDTDNSKNTELNRDKLEQNVTVIESATTAQMTSAVPLLLSTTQETSTERFIEIKIIETSSSSSTSIKKEVAIRSTKTPRTTKPTRTRTTKTTKVPKTKKTTTTTEATSDSETVESKTSNSDLPVSRKDLLRLIKNEMETYEKKSGGSPISNKNITMISERILQYLIENGTSVGIFLKENKDGSLNYIKTNETINNKIYGAGSESKFPPIFEFIVQRMQAYFSNYIYEDLSRPASTESTELKPTLREETDDDDDDAEDSESSTLSNQEVMEQLEDEISEYLDSDVVKNVTQIQLPSLIKSAYERFQSWFAPSKPSAKEEPIQESDESQEESTEATDDKTKKKPTKKPSLIKSAYEAIETIFSVFEDLDASDEEEKTDPIASNDKEGKESQDDLEESEAIKETMGENVYEFLKLAYTLYDEDES